MASQNLPEIIRELSQKAGSSYHASRIVNELRFAARLSFNKGGEYDGHVAEAAAFTLEASNKKGPINAAIVKKAEAMLAPLAEEAKKLSVICVSHAHIDMNWMWRYDETVAITLDTFRTMLDLMKEYPGFTYAQSQASVYKIAEEFEPEMLKEIKKRVREGRWELTASTWVEADKNMPSGESQTRQILYTKRYLSKLFGVSPESLNLDFEPDTFGHNQNVPEILNSAGVKYYYHCRGHEDNIAYRWRAPSGAEIIVYREPMWYNADIGYDTGVFIPDFCSRYGVDAMLKVYGVGDHGGGPTRRDLERLIDMSKWPIYPAVRFGTYSEFYKKLEAVRESLPVVTGELNFVFDGCYTTQTRIKNGNKVGENMLYEAEAFSALAGGKQYPAGKFEQGWRNVLFNQFHDIIPGSGVTDTREYALGLYQETFAIANTERTRAMRAVAAGIDTASLLADEDIADTRSEGGGVGFETESFKASQAGRAAGSSRAFTVFNPSPFTRCEPVELVVWDYNLPASDAMFKDADGNMLTHQVINSGKDNFWGHTYLKALVEVEVTAMGYKTIVLCRKPADAEQIPWKPGDLRTQGALYRVIENDKIRIKFDAKSAFIDQFKDKSDNREYVDHDEPNLFFQVVDEDGNKGMSAWMVANHMNLKPLLDNVKIKSTYSGPLRSGFFCEASYSASKINAHVYVQKGSPFLYYEVNTDWREFGSHGGKIPSLTFFMTFGYPNTEFLYDIPFGTISRDGKRHDVPATSFVFARAASEPKSFMLVSKNKHGFRCHGDEMQLTLIRSSYDPDPTPEVGANKTSFAVGLIPSDAASSELINISSAYSHPMSVISVSSHGGKADYQGSFLQVEGANLSAVKRAEDDADTVIIRLFEADGKASKAMLTFASEVISAQLVDANEKPAGVDAAFGGNTVSLELPAGSVRTVAVKLK